MKRLIIHIFLSMLCFTAFATNKAILIGIGEYPKYTGWKTISSKNDIDLLQKALPSTYTIRTLINGEATHQNVVKTLKDITKQSLQGDTVFIHFSCHGQQMITNDSDEPDHLDEALIPFDASQTKSRDYDGHNHLTDNELGALLNSLRKKVGRKGLVIVTIDACFSDSMNKGDKKTEDDGVIYRGGADIFGSNEISSDSLNSIRAIRAKADEFTVESMEDGSDIIILSACKSFQKNREVKIDGIGYGSLSYSMAQSFETHCFNNIKEWIETVYKHMSINAYTQEPQLRTTLNISVDEKTPPPPPLTSCEGHANNWMRHPVIIAVALLLALIIFGYIWKRTIRK